VLPFGVLLLALGVLLLWALLLAQTPGAASSPGLGCLPLLLQLPRLLDGLLLARQVPRHFAGDLASFAACH